MAKTLVATTPVQPVQQKKRKPWWHQNRWPQIFRMVLLGKSPIISDTEIKRRLDKLIAKRQKESAPQGRWNLLQRIRRGRVSPARSRARVEAELANEFTELIKDRSKTLDEMRDFAKMGFAAVSGLDALIGIMFVFTPHPPRLAVHLALTAITGVTLAVAILTRCAMPPPKALWTNYDEPTEWIGKKVDPKDRLLVLYKLVHDRSAIAQFLKRALVLTGMLVILGLTLFVTFLYIAF
ncbi:MAG TPA: hypothetical protein VMT30_05350 [Candidatus Saccharimonadia bacterium]|nr:hypothetical protein [Candidatus Saccharimonadia bacterium]